jgi:hypothetical protein
LEQKVRDARSTLAAERLAARRLEKARQALGAARHAAGEEQEGQLGFAREALDGIAPGSFSADAANGLRRQLEELERNSQQIEPSAAEPASDSPPAGVPARDPDPPAEPRVRSVPAPSPAPALRQQQPAAGRSGAPPQPAPVAPVDDAPYRERPLF